MGHFEPVDGIVECVGDEVVGFAGDFGSADGVGVEFELVGFFLRGVLECAEAERECAHGFGEVVFDEVGFVDTEGGGRGTRIRAGRAG